MHTARKLEELEDRLEEAGGATAAQVCAVLLLFALLFITVFFPTGWLAQAARARER